MSSPTTQSLPGPQRPPPEGRLRRTGQELHDVEGPGRLVRPPVMGRRRPTGEPPPLPHPLRKTGRILVALLVLTIAFWTAIVMTNGAVSAPIEALDRFVLREVAGWRTGMLTSLARAVAAVDDDRLIRVAAWVAIVVPLVFGRSRHALVFLGAVLTTRATTTTVSLLLMRPRPLGVPILGHWEGFAHPSRPMATLAVTLVGLCYALIPRGPRRQAAKWAAAGVLFLVGCARVYLAVDNPSDAFVGSAMGVAIGVVAFRVFAPNDVFPVTFHRGQSAHLDVTGARGEAIRRALEDQLGLRVLEIAPFGLEGSAGSTPLRIKVAGDPPSYLFGKLYAKNHLRSDRWYKLGRTLLYGRLEDESTFNTVRRLVQYEDYLLRLFQAAGVPSAEPYGFVEISPEREYLLVTEFFTGAHELREVTVDDSVIDEGLRIVRRLWDAGLAHRDIKPSNVLVRDGHMLLIDVAFGEVRPSPWRQAVDLANMMLTLALASSAPRVYEHALRYFTRDEIGEAFAATRGVTSPTQLRGMLRREGQTLIDEFRALAPPRRRIRIQRWTVRRVGLTVAVLLGAVVVSVIIRGLLQNAVLL